MDSSILGVLSGIFVFSLFFLIEKFCKKKSKNKIEPDATLIDFNVAKYNIAYRNKVERVKAKISELEQANLHKIIAEQIAGLIIVDLAEKLVELDKEKGIIDELYSN